MINNRLQILKNIDWISVGIYLTFVLVGWFNIYAADYNPDNVTSIFNPSTKAGKQFIWILGSLVIITVFYLSDYKIFEALSYLIFGFTVVLLIAVLFVGTVKNGARSWFDLGIVSLQPSEFAKISSCLALSKFLSTYNQKNLQNKYILYGTVFIFIPVILILLQNDTGSTLVFFSLLLVLYINGIRTPLFFAAIGFILVFGLSLTISKVYLIIFVLMLSGLIIYFFRKKKKVIFSVIIMAFLIILEIFGTQFFVTKILKPHQQNRIAATLNPELDPLGIGYNVIQSKIAIGSGGFTGKGFLNGNITKGDFVPEQFTDFIFCTVGEEHGFIGSFLVVGLFVLLLLRLIFLAERQKSYFSYLYGYSVVSVILFHFLINICLLYTSDAADD